MNAKDFTYLLQHPDKMVSPMQANQLEEVLEEFPYFQTARALHLKGLKNLNSFKYNKALKITAAYTADREVLFDLITSKDFLQNNIADRISGKISEPVAEEIDLKEKTVQKTETTDSEPSKASNLNDPVSDTSKDRQLSLTKEEADALLDPQLFASKDPEIDRALLEKEQHPSEEEQNTSKAQDDVLNNQGKTSGDLDLGEPLPFTKKEKYSFREWLQLTSFKPIKRGKKPSGAKEREIGDIEFPLDEENHRKKKFDLIDKFIADNPKIKPQKDVPKIVIGDSAKFDNKELMTETLAKVYLEQKKYKKAIQAYRILSLKYPEKSGFFADRIKAVERLKENNEH